LAPSTMLEPSLISQTFYFNAEANTTTAVEGMMNLKGMPTADWQRGFSCSGGVVEGIAWLSM